MYSVFYFNIAEQFLQCAPVFTPNNEIANSFKLLSIRYTNISLQSSIAFRKGSHHIL